MGGMSYGGDQAMLLHTDIPSRGQIERLLVARERSSVSVYLATDPASANDAERIELRNLVSEAAAQLTAASVGSDQIKAIVEGFEDLQDDEDFWRAQARSLAVFATPDRLTAFRLPNRLVSAVEVSDRFYVKPLLRTVTFPQSAFVLALAQDSVRLVEIGPEMEPAEVRLPDMPSDAASAVGRASIAGRSPAGRIQGSEGQKVRLRQYARKVDQALAPFLNGLDLPLILAAAEPLASIFHSVCSYPQLAPTGIAGNPERTADAELASAAREVLDGLYSDELRRTRELFALRGEQGRATADINLAARAATYGAIDTLLVDIDHALPGSIDEQSGEVELATEPAADRYGVIDEIARRAWLTGARVLAVRRDEIPGEGPLAAILRYRLA